MSGVIHKRPQGFCIRLTMQSGRNVFSSAVSFLNSHILPTSRRANRRIACALVFAPSSPSLWPGAEAQSASLLDALNDGIIKQGDACEGIFLWCLAHSECSLNSNCYFFIGAKSSV